MAAPKTVNLVLIGDAGVGKTNLATRFAREQFDAQSPATTGADTWSREVQVNGETLTVVIWDTAGQERFRAISRSYFRRADGVLVVYDITRPDTFRHVDEWLAEARATFDGPIMLVGNKSDKNEVRAVARDTAQQHADKIGLPYEETSALTAERVNRVFRLLIAAVYKRQEAQASATASKASSRGLALSSSTPPANVAAQGGSRCCGR